MDNFLFSQKFDESPLLYVDQSFYTILMEKIVVRLRLLYLNYC